MLDNIPHAPAGILHMLCEAISYREASKAELVRTNRELAGQVVLLEIERDNALAEIERLGTIMDEQAGKLSEVSGKLSAISQKSVASAE